MSPFLLRASRSTRRPLAMGALLAAAGLAAPLQAQNAAPFYFPAAPSTGAQVQVRPQPAAAPTQALAPLSAASGAVQGAAPYAAPAPFSAQRPYAEPSTGFAPAGAASASTGFAPATVAAPAGFPATLQPAAAAPIYNPAPVGVPAAAPVARPVPNPAAPVAAPAPAPGGGPGPILSPRPSAAPSGSAGLANVFSPVATVNDRVITRFDVEQRARILAAADEASGVSPASLLNEALQTLVSDQVKIQAAKDAGIEITPEGMAQGLGEIAQQNGMPLDSMIAFFRARGVERASVEAQVASEILWRDYLRARYRSRIEPSDLEIAAAVAADPSASRDQARSRLISERAALTSRSVLQDLRRKAVIELKNQ